MAKFLCISDIHLDYPSDPESRSIDLFYRTSARFAELIRNLKPDAVINLGDTNHRDGGMSAGTISLAYEFFDPIFEACIAAGSEMFTIIGNHDQYTRNGEMHVMEMLKWAHGTVVDEAMMATVKGVRIGLVPYRRDLDDYYEQVSEVEGAQMIFTHMDIVGARMNSGIISSHGADPDLFDVPVFNGHYHYPHTVGRVTVIGAPQYTQFRDLDPEDAPVRGFSLITKTKAQNSKPKIERIANPHTDLFCKVKGQSAEILDSGYGAWYGAALEKYGNDKGQLNITGKVNVWFAGPQHELDKVNSKNDWDGFGITRFTPTDRVEKESETLALDLAPMRVLEAYHEGLACSCEKTHPIDLGREILEEAGAYIGVERTGAHVEFVNMKVRDFMVLGEVEVPLYDPGLVLIEGTNLDDSSVDSNESGKSSISEALLWALFDKTSRGIGKDDVIRKGAEEASVEIAMTINSERFIITRTRSKGKPLVTIVRTPADGEDEDITPHDQREANQKIVELLGVDFEQFLLMVVLAQGFDTKFSSMSDTAKKELLESFLGLGIYENARLVTKERLKAVEGHIHELERKESGLSGSIDATHRYLEGLRAEASKATEENSARRAELQAQIATFDQPLEEWSKVVSQCRDYVKWWTEEFMNKQNARRTIESQIASARSEKTYAEREKGLLEQKYASLQSSPQMKCNECQQPLPPSRVEAYVTKVKADLERAVENARAAVGKLSALEGQLQQAQAAEAQVKASLDEANQKIAEVERGHAEVYSNHQKLVYQLEAIPENLTNYEDLIRKSEATLFEAETQRGEIIEERLAAAEEGHMLEFWEQAFDPKGIRSQLLRTIVNKLNEDLSEMSETLTGGAFTVQLSSETETKTRGAVNKLDLQILPSGESYKAGSGGKRRKVDILLNLAIARLAQETSGFSSNLLVADEVLDNLDLTASQHALTLFNNFSTVQKRLVLLISHNPAIKSLVPDVWTVIRENGVSDVRIS